MMPEHQDAAQQPATFGQRLRQARDRQGMTRDAVGGLAGRSGSWVKGLECGRISMPRMPMLFRLAEILGITDLAELTGEERLAAATYTKAAHDALPAVRQALTTYALTTSDDIPSTVAELETRVRQAWQLWHGSGGHRTRVAGLLPQLIEDLQHTARALDGTPRRRVLTLAAQAYHLAQLYLSFQPVPELVMLTGDRAMTAAQDADDPYAIAAAAWYMNHVFRDAGERHEARVELAMNATRLLRPDRSSDDVALDGLLHLACALSYAKTGRRGDAEHHWDKADAAARRLGTAYAHPWLVFGRGMVDAYAITMNTDLMQPRAAIDVANRLDVEAIPSATRRSFHLIEAARAHHQDRDPIATVALLKLAHTESPETIRYNIFSRGVLGDLEAHGAPMIRRDAGWLRHEIGAPAAA